MGPDCGMGLADLLKQKYPKGRKDDDGKTQWHLVPWGAMESVVQVLEHGANRYTPWGWRAVADGKTRYFNAAMRHLLAWRRGEILDPGTELPHLAHAACCVLFLLALDRGE